MFRLARETRDAWVNWPARAAALIAAELGLEPAAMQKVLEAHVRAHLDELAEVRLDLSWTARSSPSTARTRSCGPGAAGSSPTRRPSVSEWADRYRTLSSRAAAEPGRYHRRTPYMKDIMDALSPGHPAQRIVFMKAAQVGATEAGNCFLGFIIHQAPGPALAGAADRRAGEAQLAPADRSADRGERGAQGQSETGPLARRRQHDAVEGVCRRHPDHDGRQLGGGGCARPRRATSSSTRSTPIRRRPTTRAIRSPSPRPGRAPSPGGARCSSPRRQRSRGCRGSSGSSRPPTSGGTSCLPALR